MRGGGSTDLAVPFFCIPVSAPEGAGGGRGGAGHVPEEPCANVAHHRRGSGSDKPRMGLRDPFLPVPLLTAGESIKILSQRSGERKLPQKHSPKKGNARSKFSCREK